MWHLQQWHVSTRLNSKRRQRPQSKVLLLRPYLNGLQYANNGWVWSHKANPLVPLRSQYTAAYDRGSDWAYRAGVCSKSVRQWYEHGLREAYPSWSAQKSIPEAFFYIQRQESSNNTFTSFSKSNNFTRKWIVCEPFGKHKSPLIKWFKVNRTKSWGWKLWDYSRRWRNLNKIIIIWILTYLETINNILSIH